MQSACAALNATPQRDHQEKLLGSRFVIFDGACGFCTYCVSEAKKLDRRGRFVYVPLQSCTGADFERFGTTEEACRRAVHVIDGRVRRRGAFAVNRFFWSIGVGRPVIVALWCIWPLLVTEVIAYAFIAKNRVWISRLFRTQNCSIWQE